MRGGIALDEDTDKAARLEGVRPFRRVGDTVLFGVARHQSSWRAVPSGGFPILGSAFINSDVNLSHILAVAIPLPTPEAIPLL